MLPVFELPLFPLIFAKTIDIIYISRLFDVDMRMLPRRLMRCMAIRVHSGIRNGLSCSRMTSISIGPPHCSIPCTRLSPHGPQPPKAQRDNSCTTENHNFLRRLISAVHQVCRQLIAVGGPRIVPMRLFSANLACRAGNLNISNFRWGGR